jgi:hypothetical protein
MVPFVQTLWLWSSTAQSVQPLQRNLEELNLNMENCPRRAEWLGRVTRQQMKSHQPCALEVAVVVSVCTRKSPSEDPPGINVRAGFDCWFSTPRVTWKVPYALLPPTHVHCQIRAAVV